MTFIALVISILISGSLISCTLFRPLFEPSDIDPNSPSSNPTSPASDILSAASTAAPPPYKEILVLISAMLSSGIFVDNRRKDTVIKVLKSKYANKNNTPSQPRDPQTPDPAG